MKRIWDKINDCWIYEVSVNEISKNGWKNPHNDPVILCISELGVIEEIK